MCRKASLRIYICYVLRWWNYALDGASRIFQTVQILCSVANKTARNTCNITLHIIINARLSSYHTKYKKKPREISFMHEAFNLFWISVNTCKMITLFNCHKSINGTRFKLLKIPFTSFRFISNLISVFISIKSKRRSWINLKRKSESGTKLRVIVEIKRKKKYSKRSPLESRFLFPCD